MNKRSDILLNVPEPVKVDSEFVYNFYTKDERTNTAGRLDVVDLSDSSQENIQLAKLDKYLIVFFKFSLAHQAIMQRHLVG